MKWWEKLDKKKGSRPRCLLLVDGDRNAVAERLRRLVDYRGVKVSPDDKWMPYGKPVCKNGSGGNDPAEEAQLDNANPLVSPKIQEELQTWWLVNVGRTTPNWDIASTCKIMNTQGLLLIEAKAHEKELSESDKSRATDSANRKQICQAIKEANAGLGELTEDRNAWNLSRDSHYEMSNRFAWSWKLASLCIPVVLVYLGFLNATDMKDGRLFHLHGDWERALKEYSKDTMDNSCWETSLNVKGRPLIPLIRSIDQPFNPRCPSSSFTDQPRIPTL